MESLLGSLKFKDVYPDDEITEIFNQLIEKTGFEPDAGKIKIGATPGSPDLVQGDEEMMMDVYYEFCHEKFIITYDSRFGGSSIHPKITPIKIKDPDFLDKMLWFRLNIEDLQWFFNNFQFKTPWTEIRIDVFAPEQFSSSISRPPYGNNKSELKYSEFGELKSSKNQKNKLSKELEHFVEMPFWYNSYEIKSEEDIDKIAEKLPGRFEKCCSKRRGCL